MLKPTVSPMPPLRALRAFEAAARHVSFLRAAQELGVTAGAIAQQVRHLEDWLGRPMFHRHAQGISLTTEAALVLDSLNEAFVKLGSAVQLMRAVTSPEKVRIAALPCIAQIWLSPRLPAMRKAFPNLEISISALEEPPTFARDLYDLALFYLEEAPRDVRSTDLGGDALFPVCSPSLSLTSPSDLPHQTLLHDATWKDDWARWLSAARIGGVPAQRGPAFSLYSIALQTAIDGGGVLIGRRTLVEDALRRGKLIKPFEFELQVSDRLMLLSPVDRMLPERQVELTDWLQSEAAGTSQA